MPSQPLLVSDATSSPAPPLTHPSEPWKMEYTFTQGQTDGTDFWTELSPGSLGSAHDFSHAQNS